MTISHAIKKFQSSVHSQPASVRRILAVLTMIIISFPLIILFFVSLSLTPRESFQGPRVSAGKDSGEPAGSDQSLSPTENIVDSLKSLQIFLPKKSEYSFGNRVRESTIPIRVSLATVVSFAKTGVDEMGVEILNVINSALSVTGNFIHDVIDIAL